jgi:hypothetical protein
MDNNSHTQFVVHNAVGEDREEQPLLETYDITILSERLIPGDYEGVLDVTIVATGDTVLVDVSFHITTDGLVDIEAL